MKTEKQSKDIPLEVTWGEGEDPVGAVDEVADAATGGSESDADVPTAAVADAEADAEAYAAVRDDAACAASDTDSVQTAGRAVWGRLFQSEDLPQVTLRDILGGDFLLGHFLRREIGFILLIVFLSIIYITNRYAAQQEIILEESLRKELVEKRNFALTRYSELTQQSRQSVLEQKLRANGDTTLTIPKEPPFYINK